MERANAPSRATASLTVTFGLMSIPCAIYSGTEESGIQRKSFVNVEEEQADGTTKSVLHPVGKKDYDKETGGDVAYEDIIKLIETDHGVVEVTDEELASLVEAAPGTAEVVCFLPLAFMASGQYVPEKMYQIKPKREGSGKNKVEVSGKPFDLFMAAMRKQGVFAIVRTTIKAGQAPRYGALMPNERLYMLHFDNEVRATLERTPNEIPEAMLDRAVTAIAEATVKEPPSLVDETSARIRAFAAEKAKEGKAPELTEVKPPVQTVDDLEQVLAAMGV